MISFYAVASQVNSLPSSAYDYGVFKTLETTTRVDNNTDVPCKLDKVPEFSGDGTEVIEHLIYYTGKNEIITGVSTWEEFEQKILPEYQTIRRTKRRMSTSRWLSTVIDSELSNRDVLIENITKTIRLAFVSHENFSHQEYWGDQLVGQYSSRFGGESSSCMTNNDGCTQLWGSNPAGCRLVVVKNSEGDFIGRCLVFKPSEQTSINKNDTSPIGAGWHYGRIYAKESEETDWCLKIENYLRSIGVLSLNSFTSGNTKWVMLKMGKDRLCPYVDRGYLLYEDDDVIWYCANKIPTLFESWNEADNNRTDGSGFGASIHLCTCCESRMDVEDSYNVYNYGDVCNDCIDGGDFTWSGLDETFYRDEDAQNIYAPDHIGLHDECVGVNTRSVYCRGRRYDLITAEYNGDTVWTLEEYCTTTIDGDLVVLDEDEYTSVDWVVVKRGSQVVLMSTDELDGKYTLSDNTVTVKIVDEEHTAGMILDPHYRRVFDGCTLIFYDNVLRFVEKAGKEMFLHISGDNPVLVDDNHTVLYAGAYREALVGSNYYQSAPPAIVNCQFSNFGNGWSISPMLISPTVTSPISLYQGSSIFTRYSGYRTFFAGSDRHIVEKVMSFVNIVTGLYGDVYYTMPSERVRIASAVHDSNGNIYLVSDRCAVLAVYVSSGCYWCKCRSTVDLNSDANRDRWQKLLSKYCYNKIPENLTITDSEFNNVATNS